MVKEFCPMLGKEVDLNILKYPCYVSTKLDGIRAIFKDGELLSRSLKPIGNDNLRKKYQHVLDWSKETGIILDGEFYSPELPFTEISSVVRKSDKEVPEHLEFYVFDMYDKDMPSMPFKIRQATYKHQALSLGLKYIEQTKVQEQAEIEAIFDSEISKGGEGVIIRNPDMPYKFGRSTAKEQSLLKMKPFVTFDSKVISIQERMENTIESETNELGHSFKRRFQENMVPTGIASTATVTYEDTTVDVVFTGDEDFRREIWTNRDKYIGKYLEYKCMLVGSKDRPRHPVFLRFREIDEWGNKL